MGPEIHSKDLYFPGCGSDQGEQHTDRGRLTGPVLTQKTVYIRGLHGKGQIIDGMLIPKMLCEMGNLDDGGHGIDYQCNLRCE